MSNGGNLGFRRAILEYDNLAEIDSLYDAVCGVDAYKNGIMNGCTMDYVIVK